MAYNREIFGIGKLKSTRKNDKPYFKGVIDTGYTKYSFTCYPSESGETMKVSLFKWNNQRNMMKGTSYSSYRSSGYKKRF